MNAVPGDRLLVFGRSVDQSVRMGTIVQVRGTGGAPPYLIQWDDVASPSLLYPGPDAAVRHPANFGNASGSWPLPSPSGSGPLRMPWQWT
jgi:hypothetical protein